jgi:hypothetical protein
MQPPSLSPSGRPRRRNVGFTILEVAMSAFILAFSVMTSLTVVSTGFHTVDNARNTTIASQILQSAMEDLRMLPYTTTTAGANSISNLEASTDPVSGNNVTGNTIPGVISIGTLANGYVPAVDAYSGNVTTWPHGPYPALASYSDPVSRGMVLRFTVTRNITDVTTLSTTMKQISLTATWTGIDGRTHSLTYSSYYCKDGLHDYYVR